MSLNTTDRIFLAVGLIDFGGIFVWARRRACLKDLILQRVGALKSRLVAGFSGTGLIHFW